MRESRISARESTIAGRSVDEKQNRSCKVACLAFAGRIFPRWCPSPRKGFRLAVSVVAGRIYATLLSWFDDEYRFAGRPNFSKYEDGSLPRSAGGVSGLHCDQFGHWRAGPIAKYDLARRGWLQHLCGTGDDTMIYRLGVSTGTSRPVICQIHRKRGPVMTASGYRGGPLKA